MIYDICCYNGEKDLFEIRYNILKDYVDQFIVVEFDKTFSGKPKPWRFADDFEVHKFDKAYYHRIEEKDYIKYKELAENSPNTKGAEHWKREFMQKESIKNALLNLKEDDIVFISDCDEIWKPLEVGDGVYKLSQKVYVYYFNNRSNEKWYGTIASKYKNIKNSCLNHLRTHPELHIKTENDGWHFTSLKDILRRKLEDSYTEESYATPWVMEHLEENIKENKDFLGRDITFKVDESELPQYLLDNREKYLHLLK